MNAFLLAISFLTAIPVRAVAIIDVGIGRSVRYFPLVGLGIGGVLIGLDAGLSPIMPRSLVDMLLVLALTLLTRGLHLDGLADTVDGLGGGRNPDEALEIMKDSRTGAFGAAAIFFDLSLKYLLIGALSGPLRLMTLGAFPVLSRWAMSLSLAWTTSPRGEDGIAGWYAGRTANADAVVSSAVAIGAAVLLLGVMALPALAATALVAFVVINRLDARLGGMTGDNHGALNELVELAVLITLVVAARISV